jgi:hypothetical protein
MRRTAVTLGLIFALTALTQAAEIQGVIADWACVKPMVKNGREEVLRHNRSCSLVNNYERQAYGLITSEKKFYKLEDPGNQHVLQLLNNTPDKDNLKVVVRGEVQGDTIKVSDMTML